MSERDQVVLDNIGMPFVSEPETFPVFTRWAQQNDYSLTDMDGTMVTREHIAYCLERLTEAMTAALRLGGAL